MGVMVVDFTAFVVNAAFIHNFNGLGFFLLKIIRLRMSLIYVCSGLRYIGILEVNAPCWPTFIKYLIIRGNSSLGLRERMSH